MRALLIFWFFWKRLDFLSHVDALTGAILKCVNASPELETAAGFLFYVGSGAATAVGGVLSLGSQIGMTVISLQAMGITSVSAFGTMAASAWASAGAVWAAMAPLIPLILAIAAAALIATAAIYVLSGAQGAIDQAEADSQQANDADKELYDKQVQRRNAGQKSMVKEGESFEQWQKRLGRGAEDDHQNGLEKAPTKSAGAGAGDVAAIRSQIDNLQNKDFSAPDAASMGDAPSFTPASIGAPAVPMAAPPAPVPSTPQAASGPDSDIAAALAAAASTSGAFGNGVRQIAEGSGKAAGDNAASKSSTNAQQITVPIGSQVTAGREGYTLHFIVEDVTIPYQGIAGLKGKVKR